MGIFKKKRTKKSFVCTSCTRSTNISTEPTGHIVLREGKPVCIICRATKFSPLSKQIAKDKIKYETDQHNQEEKSKAKALEEVKEIAWASQERAKRYELQQANKKPSK